MRRPIGPRHGSGYETDAYDSRAGLVVCGWASLAETIDTHKTFRPQEIKWGPGRLVYPPERSRPFSMATQKHGMFALRVKMPKGYSIAPHMHAGRKSYSHQWQIHLGLGQAADHAGVEILPAGSSRRCPRAWFTMFRRRGFGHSDQRPGPWDIDYVNPKDDPRLNGAPEPPKSQLYSSEHR